MKVGIIGSGTMGTAIAQVFAKAGWTVLLVDVSLTVAVTAKTRISDALYFKVEQGKIDISEAEEISGLIIPASKAGCVDCDLIVEAAVEDMSIKKATFKELDSICKSECIFATNTSSLSITELSAGLSRPVVGMHFFNPATRMKLVEVISGLTTPEEYAEKVYEIAGSIGKEPVRVLDNPGFVVNRILTPMLNEAIGVFAEGTASAEDIDKALVLGCNMPMGPLKLCDLCGLDVVLAVCETLQRETGDQKYRPHPLLRKMVRAGLLGTKTGKGFYCYDK